MGKGPEGQGLDLRDLARRIKGWARELGFQRAGIAGVDLEEPYGRRLRQWLAEGRHGEMGWMARHGSRRWRPAELVPGTLRVISVAMDYWPGTAREPWSVLRDPKLGYLSRYALGRDYHKVLRGRLRRLAARIQEAVGPFGHRVFVDSGPVLEKPLAEQAGLGWIGKHTNLIHPRAGSWCFLGELLVDLPLPVDRPATAHCGSCTACITACPTGAIVAPYRLDARLCISYLTIEHPGPIPEPLRPLMGNRVYGCDDCQLVCPWNKFARPTPVADFLPRHGLDAPRLAALLDWDEATFLHRTEGMALRRLGHERWLRNVAVALGNAPPDPRAREALRRRLAHPSALVREHVRWALDRQAGRLSGAGRSSGNAPGSAAAR